MIYLLLSILCSSIIAILFSFLQKFEIKLFPVIVLNYFAATFIGFSLNNSEINFSQIIQSNWLYVSVIVGILLIMGFYLIGFSTQKVGISATTVSNKMSFIIPMMFSILYYAESINYLKIIGIILTIISVLLSVYRKPKERFNLKSFYLPVLLFIVIGLIDASIKLAQTEFLDEKSIPLFTAFSFGLAGVIGIVACFFNSSKLKDFFKLKTLVVGFTIGAANYGSMYFLIFALNKSNLDSSIVYGLNNIGIITISVLIAFFVFKEKLLKINWIGFFLAIIAIILLTGFYKNIF